MWNACSTSEIGNEEFRLVQNTQIPSFFGWKLKESDRFRDINFGCIN